MATVLILIALIVVLALAARSLRHDVKSGTCPGGCAGCGGACPHASLI